VKFISVQHNYFALQILGIGVSFICGNRSYKLFTLIVAIVEILGTIIVGKTNVFLIYKVSYTLVGHVSSCSDTFFA